MAVVLLGVLGLTLNRLMLALDRALIHWRGVE
jgi:ABC-type nitrate/sulfonate/bicarbonate transport system permease component